MCLYWTYTAPTERPTTQRGGRMDTRHEPPERAPTEQRRSGRLSWLRIALQVTQTAAILFRAWHDL